MSGTIVVGNMSTVGSNGAYVASAFVRSSLTVSRLGRRFKVIRELKALDACYKSLCTYLRLVNPRPARDSWLSPVCEVTLRTASRAYGSLHGIGVIIIVLSPVSVRIQCIPNTHSSHAVRLTFG